MFSPCNNTFVVSRHVAGVHPCLTLSAAMTLAITFHTNGCREWQIRRPFPALLVDASRWGALGSVFFLLGGH